MAELTPAQLLALVGTVNRENGNPRVQQITQRIVSDLFRAVDDLDIQPDEFWAGIDWLTRLGAAGQTGLITAGLGFDRLLDIREDEADRRQGREGGTPRAIEGPLYVPGAPVSEGEARLDDGSYDGEIMVMEGRVLDADGKPVAGAMVEAWHANENGTYSHFDPSQSPYNLRRAIRTDAQGCYRFRSFLPPGYAIPPAGPVAELFAAIGRHGNRPAHIHFLISAPGLRTLTTQVNLPGDTYIDDDFAFATRDGLIVELEPGIPSTGYESLGLTAPFTRIRFDFSLQRAENADEQVAKSRMERATAA